MPDPVQTELAAFPWPDGRRAALCLTYDDALACHRQTVARQLADAGVMATFYVPAGFPGLLDHAPAWRNVAGLGHELGNHTVIHPCRDDPPGTHRWLDPGQDLVHYTKRRWDDEIRTANGVLRLIDGRERRSFGNTCHHDRIGPGQGDGSVSITATIREHCVAGRGRCTRQIADPRTCELGGIGCYGGDGLDLAALIAIADAAESAGGWAIICFHSVGPADHHLHVDAGVHAALVTELARRRERLWCIDVATAALWVAARR